jgi:hypothetical protein
MIEYINEDLFLKIEPNDLILHQCNLTYGLGAGFAGVVAKKRPDIYQKEKEFITGNNKATKWLGNFREYNWGDKSKLINIYSQYNVGGCSNNLGGLDSFEARIIWLESALIKIANTYKVGSIKMPLVASGLAADSKRKNNKSDLEYFKEFIEPIIQKHLNTFKIKIYYI